MNIHHPYTYASMTDLIATLDRFSDAGIDPAFDSQCEELERQFAELRFVSIQR